MKERIKQVRILNKLTQQEFADRIGCSRSGLANYEAGRNEPISPVITAICKEFNINESWLRNGHGEMIKPITRDEELAAFMGDVMRREDKDFRKRLMNVLRRLEPAEWKLLESMAMKLAAESKKEDQAEA